MENVNLRIARKLNHIARKIVEGAHSNGKAKIEHIQQGEICLSMQIYCNNDDILTIVNSLEKMLTEKMNWLEKDLIKTGLNHCGGSWDKVRIKKDCIVCLFYYAGSFDVEEAKQALKNIGLR